MVVFREGWGRDKKKEEGVGEVTFGGSFTIGPRSNVKKAQKIVYIFL